MVELDRAEIEWEKVQPNVEVPIETVTHASMTVVATIKTILLSYTLTDVTLSPMVAYQAAMVTALVASLLLLLVVRRRRKTRTNP